MDTESKIEQLERLAALGWCLVPLWGTLPPEQEGEPRPCECSKGAECGRPGKHPRRDEWQEQATADVATIRAWDARWPSANWALATGPESGVWVLDVDGPKADARLRALEVLNGDLPECPLADTGRVDGSHLYFRAGPDCTIGNASGDLPDGLDVRGCGGIIVLPPSHHYTGRVYAWRQAGEPWELEPPEAPDWLLRLIQPPTPKPKSRPAPRPRVDTGTDVHDRARRWLGSADPAVSGQGGSKVAMRVASAMVNGFGLDEDEALALLLEDWNGECVPPWSERDLERKVREAAKAGPPGDKAYGWLRDEPRRYASRKPKPSSSTTRPKPSPPPTPPPTPKTAWMAAEAAPNLEPVAPAPRPSLRVVDEDEAPPEDEGPDLEPSPPWLAPALEAAGYFVQNGFLYRVKDPIKPDRWTDVADGEVWVSALARDVDTGLEHVTVDWRGTSGSGSVTMPASDATTATALKRYRDRGLPVGDVNGGELARYLQKTMDLVGNLPRTRVTSRMGWSGEAFVVGNTIIGNGPRFNSDAGLEQLADSLEPAGTLDAWRAGVELLAEHPRALAPVWAAFAGPLLRLRYGTNPVLQLSARTSTGKSTAINAAASVWGRPSDTGGCIHSWNTTAVGLERLAGAHGAGLPLFLDDTKTCRKGFDLAGFVYDFASGRGRVRGRVDGGVQHRATWRTVLVTSGESPLVEASQEAGTRGRVLVVDGRPLPPGSEGLIDGLRACIESNHGHAGRAFVRALQGEDVRARVLARVNDWIGYFGGEATSGVGHRLAESWALVVAAGEAASEQGLCPFDADAACKVWRGILEEGERGADIPRAALEAVYAWAEPQRRRFAGKSSEPGHQGWLGAWSPTLLGIVPHECKGFLRSQGYDPNEVLRAWRDRKWISVGGITRLNMRVRAGGETLSCVPIRLEVLRSLGIAEPSDED